MEATVIMVKCSESKQTFGMRVQKISDDDWERTWAFPIKDEVAKNEGYDKTKITANLFTSSEYPGCPHCKTMNVVQCATCGKLNCYNGEDTMICGWCNNKMGRISVSEKELEFSGTDY